MDKMSKKPFFVKCTGGTTAQLLALSNAIYVSNRIGRPFKIKYFPFSTGTYWEFGISKLLEPEEIVPESIPRETEFDGLLNGVYINKFPISLKSFVRGNILKIIHRLGLNSTLRRMRGEFIIGGERKSLDSIKRNAKSISANFVPIVDEFVNREMSRRFAGAGIPNPYSKISRQNEVVVHFRLGDMRKLPQRVDGMGGHGVVSPQTFREILKLENVDLEKDQVTLVSDEPELASNVLLEVGISCKFSRLDPSIWDDLSAISQAKLFIGSMSQFSLFGGAICASNGGKVYIPSTEYGGRTLYHSIGIGEFNYFDYKYLPPEHWIFKK